MNDNTSIEFSDDELMASLLVSERKSAQEDVHYYSNPNKEACEREVVGEFLRLLKVTYTEDELHSEPQSSKTDVTFREACFQIKEILHPGAMPHGEAHDRLKSLMAASRYQDINYSSVASDIPSPTTIYALVSKEAEYQSNKEKYKCIKAELDLLVDVTQRRASQVKQSEIDLICLSSPGWRSISCLAGRQAKVLFVSSNAPSFLQDAYKNQ